MEVDRWQVLRGGGGAVKLDSVGITFVTGSNRANSVVWSDGALPEAGVLYVDRTGVTASGAWGVNRGTATTSTIQIITENESINLNSSSGIDIISASNIDAQLTTASRFRVLNNAAVEKFYVDTSGNIGADGDAAIDGGLNVGTSTGAAAGQIKASSSALVSGGLTVGGATLLSGAGEITSTAGIYQGLLDSARAYNNAALSITNNTATILTLNAERWDGNTIHSTSSNTSRLTCKTAGKYIVVGGVEFAANATGRRQVEIFLNNTTTLASHIDFAPSGTVVSRLQVTTIADLAVNDYVELRVLQDSGGALNVNSTAQISPELMFCRLV